MATKSKHWVGAKNTNRKAAITDYMNVKNSLVIEVKNAYYRTAKLSGLFLVSNVENPFKLRKGALTIEIECLWDGTKPKSTWAHLIIKNKYKLHKNYSGKEVAANSS